MNRAIKQLLTLSFALLFMTGAAMAQNNDAYIEQITPGPNAVATATQGGLDNVSRIFQTSHDGSATQWQNGEENFARIDQEGSGSSSVSQEQDGNLNEARAVQFSYQNSVIVQKQTGNENYAEADQGFRRNSKSVQVQEGDGHYGYVLQRSNVSLVRQDQLGGQDNEAVTRQLNKTRLSTALTTQLGGVGNRGVIVQDGSNGHFAEIVQDGGTGGFARIDQSGVITP